MELKWTSRALSDLVSLHDFLATVDEMAAARTVQSLTAAPVRLLMTPRLGTRLAEFDPREVRKILVASCELRYEICQSKIYVLRLWHSREDR